MRRLLLLSICVASFGTAVVRAEAVCPSMSPPVAVQVEVSNVIRKDSPKTLFGFALDWFQFQLGHIRNGEVRPEVLKWLSPFNGANYRYTGGNALDWTAMTGSIGGRRKVYAYYQGYEMPIFGPEEYLHFLKDVSGRGVFLMDVVGNRYQGNAEKVVEDNRNLLRWIKVKEKEICGDGGKCGIDAYELGNEVDWEKGVRWPALRYAERMNGLLKELRKESPDAKFIANGRTTPWSPGGDGYNESSFDNVVSAAIGSQVAGATLHLYYDGIPVPQMKSYISRITTLYSQFNPNSKIYITEHGRWPSENKKGAWSDNWYQASGGWGGLSAADFILMTMDMPQVEFVSWHSMFVTGPWQLFKWNKKADLVYPSAAYWAMRSIREGYLEDVVATKPSIVNGGDYAGGYQLRLVGMKDREGKVSVMGVNRARTPVAIKVDPGTKRFAGREGDLIMFTSDPSGADNSDAEPYRYQIERRKFHVDESGSSICIPALTSFSVIYN